MRAIPTALQTKFEERLRQKNVQSSLHGVYKKWQESLPHFIRKLQEKNQTKVQQDQALQADYATVLHCNIPINAVKRTRRPRRSRKPSQGK